ncbi:MAG: diguanylate cyclase, partial [Candidatus Caldatribacterium sp.]|nr:diguanylate cyclase [Candidatus Caldatribacterium sp.]
YLLRIAFLAALLFVALHSYFKTKFLVRERVWYLAFYGGLALASLGILIAPFPEAFLLFAGLSLFLFGVGGIVRYFKRSSIRDYLTGLYSRVYFFEEWLPREVKRQNRSGGSIAFAMIDIDGLKRVNDQSGHHAGDRLLQRFASVVLCSIRREDAAVRFGGDEILLAFPGGQEEGVRKALRRIEEALPDIPFSWGVSVWEGKGDPEEAIRTADCRMYERKRAKKNGENSWCERRESNPHGLSPTGS